MAEAWRAQEDARKRDFMKRSREILLHESQNNDDCTDRMCSLAVARIERVLVNCSDRMCSLTTARIVLLPQPGQKVCVFLPHGHTIECVLLLLS